MGKFIRILLPLFPKTKDIYFVGHIRENNSSTEIFITNYSTRKSFNTKRYNEKDIIYGHYRRKFKGKIECYAAMNYLCIEGYENLEVKNIVIKGTPVNKSQQFILLLYDYDIIYNSDTIWDNNDFISTLKSYIQKDFKTFEDIPINEEAISIPAWLSSSMFIKHLLSYANLLNTMFTATKQNKKISIQRGNLILALFVDILLGYLMLELLMFSQKDVATILLGIFEKLVNYMYSLLKWLMGAPAGLKLNNAFNKMLGKYFLYHVELWWIFLDVTSGKLDLVLYAYQYLGYLGLTFQAAIISDMICLATFHSYCIYVYAARLFNIQISGLIALLRLFVGRKYNPLRGGVDSCEYTNPQLFVGTVAFTILLLLLPTTIMYYIVFTMFRVLSMLVQYTLAKLIHVIQCTPLYVLILWTIRSSKVAGNVYIEEIGHTDTTLTLHVRLLNKSITDLMTEFKPPVDALENIEWTNVAKNVFTGKQII